MQVLPFESWRDQQKVYFMKSGDLVKIGISIEPTSRLNQLRTGNPNIELIGTMWGGEIVEELLHNKFQAYWVRGEWFQLNEEIISYIQRNRLESREMTMEQEEL